LPPPPISTHLVGGEKRKKKGGMEAYLSTHPVTSFFLLKTLAGLLDPNHLPPLLLNSEDSFMLRIWPFRGMVSLGRLFLLVSPTFPLCYSFFPQFQPHSGLSSVVASLFLQVCERTPCR